MLMAMLNHYSGCMYKLVGRPGGLLGGTSAAEVIRQISIVDYRPCIFSLVVTPVDVASTDHLITDIHRPPAVQGAGEVQRAVFRLGPHSSVGD